MIQKDRLQKAVETTLAAGYQLEKEAFEFLMFLSDKDDPIKIMSKTLERIESTKNKPLFINKTCLETTIKCSEVMKKPEQNVKNDKNINELNYNTNNNFSEKDNTFVPYAKNVESKIEIIQDPTGQLTSNGTMEEFHQYFHDRFKRMEKLLRQRMDVRAATPISEALKAQPKTKLKIIGMITEKKDVKQQLLITIEDLNASATILVPLKAKEEVHKKAQLILFDQVICMEVIKTRSNLFLAEDIIFPEVGHRQVRRASEPVYAVFTSDIHIGSKKFNKEAFKRFLLWLNGKYGNEKMRKIASHVKYVLVAGDIVDGVGVFPNQAKELVIRDIRNQYKLANKIFKRIPEYIDIIISPGNHDSPRKALPQPAISNDYLQSNQDTRKIYSLGNPCLINLHNVEILMFHGRSLDDIIGAVPNTDHQHPQKAMKILLQSRHLAPIYGGKTMLSPENRDYLVIEHVPDIFHAGHVHVFGCCIHRGVLILNSGGWQEQTDYMAKLGLVPTPGLVPVVNLQTLETTVLSFV